MIGRGSESSRVFRALNHANELYAIKRVSLDKMMNEIVLLKRLEGNSVIVWLSTEVKAGPGVGKGHHYLWWSVDSGEIGLEAVEHVNMVWVPYYWQQVAFIHQPPLLQISPLPLLPCLPRYSDDDERAETGPNDSCGLKVSFSLTFFY